MDPNRHHEFICGNDERQSAMYFNRGIEETRSNTQYFSQERVVVSNKSCMCPSMSGNISCNACPSTPEGNWTQERTHSADVQTTDVPSGVKVNPNSMYIHENRQYFHSSNNQAYTTEVLPINRHIVGTQKDRNLSSNTNCVLESNYNFKQQLQQQQQQPQFQTQPNLTQMQTQSNIATMSNLPIQQLQQQQYHQHSGIGNYTKEIIYDEKLQSKLDMYKDIKINYTPVAVDRGTLNTATMFNEESSTSPERSQKNDFINSKFSICADNNSSRHNETYKSTSGSPSMDGKYVLTHRSLPASSTQCRITQEKIPYLIDEVRERDRIHRKYGVISDKPNEMQMSSMSGYPSNSNSNNSNCRSRSGSGKFHHQQIHDAAIQQNEIPHHFQEPLMTVDVVRNPNYYVSGAERQIATVTEMPPVIAKQAQITSQYLNNPKALPSRSQLQSVLPHQSHHQPAKSTTTHDLINFKRKEDIYEPMNSALYSNPYKTSSPIDSCCKDVSTPYVNMTHTFNENIGQQQNYYKYGKTIKDTVGKNNICPQNQNTPPPTPVHRTAGYKTQPYVYETQHIKYDGNAHNTSLNMSPNVATIPSPSPSQSTPPNHVQVQPTNITGTTPKARNQSQSPANYAQTIRYQHHNQNEVYRPSDHTHLEGAAMHSNANFCTYDRTPQRSDMLHSQPATLQSQPIEPQIHPKNIQGQKTSSVKKSQVPKTNYRELINQVVAMRSATSEKELDLQIIKKALNSAAGSPVGGQPSQIVVVSSNNNMPMSVTPTVSNLENVFSMENSSTPTQLSTSKICVDTNLRNIQRTIKVEDTLGTSPLDLSMRTVRTKADSTEYRYHQEFFKNPQIDYKHALPRVDFTPNFSLHSDERSMLPKIVINHQQNANLYVSSPEGPNSIAVPIGSKGFLVQSQQPTQQIKKYSTEQISRVSAVTQCAVVAPPNDPKQKSLVLRTSDENLKMCQIRPSVVETNPFATVRSIKSEPSSVLDRNVPTTVDHLQPPSSNVVTLQKPSHSSGTELNCTPSYCSGNSVIKTPDQTSLFEMEKPLLNTASISVNMNEQRHANYLGRKRHLQEYSNSQCNEPMVKQQRYQDDRDLLPATELIRMSTISTSVVALNNRTIDENKERGVKTIETPIQAKISPCCQRESSIIVNNNIPICKIESITPTMNDTPPLTITQSIPPVATIKTETSSVIAARIRTKAELKGFTFHIPIDVGNTNKEPIKIKEEPIPCQKFNSELPSIPGLDEKYDSRSLLDFSWNNKCNDFMEQLLARSQTKKCSNCRFLNVSTERSQDCQALSNAPAGEQKTLLNSESDENRKSLDRVVDTMIDSTMTGENCSNKSPEGNSSQSTTMNTHKKISKHDREKIRSHQEKRIAARLQVESSSESDDEMHKRKSDRSKKSPKKIKVRQNTQSADSKQFSDCGSDTSDIIDVKSSPTKASIKVNEGNDDIQLVESTSKHKVKSVEQNAIETELIGKGTVSRIEKCLSISGTPKLSENGDATESSSSKKPRLSAIQIGNEEKQSKQENLLKTEQGNCKSKEEMGRSVKKPKVLLKLGLNTMTRSKRKREMELQLANSKVLRNDKIIRNSTTKIMSIKRKYVRKFVNQSSVSAACKQLTHKQSDGELPMRLRSRNDKPLKDDKTEKVPGSNNKKISRSAIGVSKNDTHELKSKSKERQSDMFLEVYRYKRSLKIPPSLITIDHPHNIKMAASLPDLELEHDSSHVNTSKNSTKFSKSIERLLQKSTGDVSDKSTQLTASLKTQPEQKSCDERRSIIDLLHSRVINSNITKSISKVKNKKNANSHTLSRQVQSDVSRSAESCSVTEILSIPVKKENEEESGDGKKRHFSIFETTVLKTKTRTESKMQQRKEIIREIFVGDDRPASAPPEIISQISELKDKMTFEQKYEQFLQQLNIVINDDKLRKYGKTASTLSSHSVSGSATASNSTANHYVKDEEDTLASNGAADADDKTLENNHRNCKITEVDCATSSFRRRRPGKYLRRKGSSGFDYIRKKKKPQPSVSGSSTQILAKIERKTEDEIYERRVKTESDVCREIQKWVLNKSVGQSAMHKAARLGYIDVVVYCLDRMGMNPDQKDNAGYTPLHEACTKGWLEIARVLLQYGANHSEAAHSGIRPLHEASENDHGEIVRLLISYGADPLLATYAGQTPLMLASSTAMRDLLNNHLSDVQNIGSDRKPWQFRGPWEILDSSIYGYDIFGGAPNFTCDMSRALRKSSISNSMSNKKQLTSSNFETANNCKAMMENCAVVLDNIDRFNSVRLYNDKKPEILVENSDSEGEMFEFEEADILLPPLYLLKDEGTDKWVLLSDLCNLLKVKSKDTLLNKIYPPSSSASSAHKSLMRELKMSDFLERATCLQLLCSGEKINICASKVVLIKYNDSVRNLLGVKTILMKF
ncbi:uncharacterized protein [Eurosta solidaginis]|uniref:uncharacterized protein isoform X2 n=1 Tax=Eurosta solidaginis TaxID=178769 RepID=UPI0035307E77